MSSLTVSLGYHVLVSQGSVLLAGMIAILAISTTTYIFRGRTHKGTSYCLAISMSIFLLRIVANWIAQDLLDKTEQEMTPQLSFLHFLLWFPLPV
jgi:hypothetical protein